MILEITVFCINAKLVQLLTFLVKIRKYICFEVKVYLSREKEKKEIYFSLQTNAKSLRDVNCSTFIWFNKHLFQYNGYFPQSAELATIPQTQWFYSIMNFMLTTLWEIGKSCPNRHISKTCPKCLHPRVSLGLRCFSALTTAAAKQKLESHSVHRD